MVGTGVNWLHVGIGIAAGLLLLFLIAMIGLCAARRRKQPAAAAATTENPYDNNVGNTYMNVGNATTNGGPVSNGGVSNGGIPPPPNAPPPTPPPRDETARVHYTNNGFTPDENGGIAAATLGPAVAVLPPGPVGKPRKHRYKKRERDPAPPRIDPNDFQLGEDQRVATVIQRLAHRLRNRLSSVRFSGGGGGPSGSGDQDNYAPEYDPESADGVPGGPERGRGAGPKRNIVVPPQLHRPPRGFAPASHSVPLGALKSSWGPGKHQRVMGKKK